jgi:hypothetical protein
MIAVIKLPILWYLIDGFESAHGAPPAQRVSIGIPT